MVDRGYLGSKSPSFIQDYIHAYYQPSQGSYLSVTNFHRLFKGATPRFVAIIMQCLQELLTIMLTKII